MSIGGFPIPEMLLDFFNRVSRRNTSVYVREEQPAAISVVWETTQYLGVPFQRVSRLTLTYPEPIPAEVYNVEYDEQTGEVLSINKATPSIVQV